MRASRAAHRILAGEAGAGAGSEDGLGEATSPSAAGASDPSSGRPNATTWGLSLALGPVPLGRIASVLGLTLDELLDGTDYGA